MNHYQEINTLLQDGVASVLVSVVHVAGSAPREAGAFMIITGQDTHGSIGGGNLEYEAIRIARAELGASQVKARHFLQLFPLGPMLEQCCGGAVVLGFEVFSSASARLVTQLSQLEKKATRTVRVSHVSNGGTLENSCLIVEENNVIGEFSDATLQDLALEKAGEILSNSNHVPGVHLHSLSGEGFALPSIDEVLVFELIQPVDFQVAVMGAGHVGTALVNILAMSLPCQVTWADTRSEQFANELPAGVSTHVFQDPFLVVQSIRPGSYCLIMTHSHQLDQKLCEAMLQRNDLAFIGLIGSATKLKRFQKRLLESGVSQKQLDKLCCPIGIKGINDKTPGAIALSVAAQLQELYERKNTPGESRAGNRDVRAR